MTNMKTLIFSSIIMLFIYNNVVLATNHNRDYRIFYDVEYRDLFIEELKKHNIKFYVNKNNPNDIALESKDRVRTKSIAKIALSKTSQHQSKDLFFKNKFLKKLNENNIPYVENVISENPPDYRIRVDEKDVKQSNLLIEELLNN